MRNIHGSHLLLLKGISSLFVQSLMCCEFLQWHTYISLDTVMSCPDRSGTIVVMMADGMFI